MISNSLQRWKVTAGMRCRSSRRLSVAGGRRCAGAGVGRWPGGWAALQEFELGYRFIESYKLDRFNRLRHRHRDGEAGRLEDRRFVLALVVARSQFAAIMAVAVNVGSSSNRALVIGLVKRGAGEASLPTRQDIFARAEVHLDEKQHGGYAPLRQRHRTSTKCNHLLYLEYSADRRFDSIPL